MNIDANESNPTAALKVMNGPKESNLPQMMMDKRRGAVQG